MTRRTAIIGSLGVAALAAWKGKGFVDAMMAKATSMLGGGAYLGTDRVIPADGYVSGVAWSRDGSRLAAILDYGRKVAVWKADGTILAKFTRHGPYVDNSIAFLSDDIVLTAASLSRLEEERLAFTLWNVKTGAASRTVDGPAPGKDHGYNYATNFCVSPDGKIVAALVATAREPVPLYSTDDWSILRRIPVTTPGIYDTAHCIAFSPDGGTLAVGLGGSGPACGYVRLVDLNHIDAAPEVIVVYSPPVFIPVNAVSFSPDGRFLATGAGGAVGAPVINAGSTVTEADDLARLHAPVKIWQVADRQIIAGYPGHIAPVRQLSWSKDSRYLAAALGDHTVRIFAPDVAEHAIAATSAYSYVNSVQFSPDGRSLAAGTDHSVTIFTLSP